MPERIGEHDRPFPAGLVVSAVGHVAVAGLVLVMLTSAQQPITSEAVPVELVPSDPAPEKEKTPGDKGDQAASAEAPQSPPPQPAPSSAETQAAKPAPPPPGTDPVPRPPGEAPSGVEPVHVVPPLATQAFDSVGRAESGRDTTITREEIEALRAQVMRCWEIPNGWTNPRQVSVTVRFQLSRSGALAGKPVIVEGPASRLGKAAADNALRALAKCGPYRMPPEKYAEWSDVQLRLAPR